jgi:hypothetical protein
MTEAERAWVDDLERRIHYLEELVDTYLHSPVWKRIWFWVEGWPADRIASSPTLLSERLKKLLR